MTNNGFAGWPSPANLVPDGSITASKLGPSAVGSLQSGMYYFTSSPSGGSTSSTLGNGLLRLTPFLVPNACRISRIGGDVSAAGEAGSKLRLGIYADDGTGYPGQLVLDAGPIAGDSATVQEITVNQALAAGVYWIGGVVQSATTSQPTVRIQSGWHSPIPMRSPSLPTASAGVSGFSQASVTGALPPVFTSSVTTAGAAPRVFIKVA